MAPRAGRFIVLEGADGCGKSTQATRLVAALTQRGRDVRHVREPGSTRVGEAVRTLLLDRASGTICARAETLLYMAARAQLVDEVLAPALAAGETVVCERWTLSTEVYQGVAGDLGVAAVQAVAPVAEAGVRPDLVLVLDLPDGAALQRITGAPDRMEAKGDAFHRRVIEGYRALASERDDHVLVRAGDVDAVAARILTDVDRRGL